jgi:membrane-bound ClpP family serine protease
MLLTYYLGMIYTFLKVLLFIACAIVSGIRFNRSAGGIFGPIGFGLIVISYLLPMPFSPMYRHMPDIRMMQIASITSYFIGFMGILCILAMLFTAKVNKKTDVSQSPTNTNPDS